MANKHIGSSFESLLEETGELEEVHAAAIKRVVAWEISKAMEEKNITKTQMATRMQTSRSSVDRLLDPNNSSVTLATMDSAARAVGKELKVAVG